MKRNVRDSLLNEYAKRKLPCALKNATRLHFVRTCELNRVKISWEDCRLSKIIPFRRASEAQKSKSESMRVCNQLRQLTIIALSPFHEIRRSKNCLSRMKASIRICAPSRLFAYLVVFPVFSPFLSHQRIAIMRALSHEKKVSVQCQCCWNAPSGLVPFYLGNAGR